MHRLAAAVAAHGRWMLVAGLAVGLASPAAAQAVRPYVGVLVVSVLFLAMVRIGPAALRLGRSDLRTAAIAVLVLQLALPAALAAALLAAGLLSSPLALATVLILAAAPITGAAPIAAMARADPGPALRLTVIGSALLPLTVVPVFALAPAFGSTAAVFDAALRLLAAVGVAGGGALILHATGLWRDSGRSRTAIDAISAVLLAVMVVGLMPAAAGALRTDPAALIGTLAFVSVLCFALQAVTVRLWPQPAAAAPMAVVAGCRNVALFLGVLPASLTDGMMMAIGCYQIPMYLTPLVLPHMLAWRHRARAR